MRVDHGLTNSIGNGNGLSSLGQVGPNSRISGAEGDDRSDDSVRLSDASALVAAAKNTQPAEQQAKIARLSAQVRSGASVFDAVAVSQALINSLK